MLIDEDKLKIIEICEDFSMNYCLEMLVSWDIDSLEVFIRGSMLIVNFNRGLWA